MKHSDREERAQIETIARKLAWSGLHSGHETIRAVLRPRNPLIVDVMFRSRWTAAELDRICDNARQKAAA